MRGRELHSCTENILTKTADFLRPNLHPATFRRAQDLILESEFRPFYIIRYDSAEVKSEK